MAKLTDEVKRYLHSAWYWQKRKDILLERIERLKSRAEKITTSFSDVPASGGYEDHRQAIIAEMVDKQEEYKKAVEECNKKTAEIKLLIAGLDGYEQDYQERLVLEMRYLHFENWQDIALKLNYHERAIYKIHGRALLHLLEVHEKMKENGRRLF